MKNLYYTPKNLKIKRQKIKEMQEKKYDTAALMEIIKKSDIRNIELARKIGRTRQLFYMKLNGYCRFSVTEAYILCQMLNIPLVEMCNYFE